MHLVDVQSPLRLRAGSQRQITSAASPYGAHRHRISSASLAAGLSPPASPTRCIPHGTLDDLPRGQQPPSSPIHLGYANQIPRDCRVAVSPSTQSNACRDKMLHNQVCALSHATATNWTSGTASTSCRTRACPSITKLTGYDIVAQSSAVGYGLAHLVNTRCHAVRAWL
jgi:hypothetical protein